MGLSTQTKILDKSGIQNSFFFFLLFLHINMLFFRNQAN